MARRKAELPPAAAIRALADAQGRLTTPGTPAARSAPVHLGEGRLLIKVRAKPEDGKANAAVLELLARALGVATSRLQLLRGTSGRDKLVWIGD